MAANYKHDLRRERGPERSTIITWLSCLGAVRANDSVRSSLGPPFVPKVAFVVLLASSSLGAISWRRLK